MLAHPTIPGAVRVPVLDQAHIIYARPNEPVDLETLCGLAITRETVALRSQARGLPLCGACDAEDLRRHPDRIRRMFR